jgi:hypothetical protein
MIGNEGRERMDKFDLRSACIHEAAHEIVANHLGAPASARVFRTDTTDAAEERTWVGQTRFLVALNDIG